MQTRRSLFGVLGTLALAGVSASAGAQPVGSEFQVNTYTTGRQLTGFANGAHLVAGDGSGNFVVVWRSVDQDGSYTGIFGQRYDASGGALGSEFRVNSYTTGYQSYPSVAAASGGDFVVVWCNSGNGDYNGVFGQRYDSAGGTLGSEFRVNTTTTLPQLNPSVASDANGNFVVAWQRNGPGDSYGIFGQRYDSSGGALGSEFRVNAYTTGNQMRPSVSSDASGNFVIVWQSIAQDGSGYGIFGQRYDSGGVAQGGEFRVNSFTTNSQSFPSIASDPGGEFVVVWESFAQDGSGYGIFGQRYDSQGAAQGGEFRVNSFTRSNQYFPSVTSKTNGDFVVVWWGGGEGDRFGVFGQRYDSAGSRLRRAFRINSFTTGAQAFPSVGAGGTDEFVVVWDSVGQDGDGDGIFGQRFDSGAPR